MFKERLNSFTRNQKDSNSFKQLKDNTRDLEEGLTTNQDLVEKRLNTLKSQLRVAQNEMIENKAELKELLRIQEDRSRRNNIRVDCIEVDENRLKHGKTQRSFFDELEITDELYIERLHHVRRRSVNANSNNIPRTIIVMLLEYKEKEEIIWRGYNIFLTTYSVREDFSKETVEIRKT